MTQPLSASTRAGPRQPQDSPSPMTMSGRPKDWAQEAFEEGKSVAYNLPSHQVRDSHNKLVYQLDRAYEDDARDTAGEQMAKAGMRLALVLNDALQ